MSERRERVAAAWAELLEVMGYPANDPHLRDTPERVGRFFDEWHTNIAEPPPLRTFPNEEKIDQMILCGGLRFYSLCAHHGLPFYGRCAVGYIPDDRLLGLSKFARVLDHFAHRFQVQERLTQQVADYLERQLKPLALGVVLRAEHLCMSMRGVERPNHLTTTSVMLGALRENHAARHELLELVR
ncbi:MAG: GTP cyclohydrolase I [Dehalococcoidia bacterium]